MFENHRAMSWDSGLSPMFSVEILCYNGHIFITYLLCLGPSESFTGLGTTRDILTRPVLKSKLFFLNQAGLALMMKHVKQILWAQEAPDVSLLVGS